MRIIDTEREIEMNLNYAAIADSPAAQSFITQIKHGDTAARTTAVMQAPLIGTEVISSLGAVYGGSDPGASKAACEALKKIALNAGRPGAKAEAKSASASLLKLASAGNPRFVRADAIQSLGYIGGPEEAAALASMFGDKEVRADCVMAVGRIPGPEIDVLLKASARKADKEVQSMIDLALRHRKTTLKEVGKKK